MSMELGSTTQTHVQASLSCRLIASHSQPLTPAGPPSSRKQCQCQCTTALCDITTDLRPSAEIRSTHSTRKHASTCTPPKSRPKTYAALYIVPTTHNYLPHSPLTQAQAAQHKPGTRSPWRPSTMAACGSRPSIPVAGLGASRPFAHRPFGSERQPGISAPASLTRDGIPAAWGYLCSNREPPAAWIDCAAGAVYLLCLKCLCIRLM
ncbi:hypothetical protein CC80DRAFT_279441 [Byssothecium circinans]|uniref:Uncharacterized protein n=1 Tax=Byssothecium circinans TaxID=147558 RepID=A0A6A5TJJ5_9PLEO|nr:hypothetical protein CC80DRAFT_279441 [Byssothecium circinans]